jgi:hypothetical protein
VLDRKTHSIVFARYSYEDVRLYNLESLVVRPILEPDKKVRLSRIGASFVRDTRERCERGLLGQTRSSLEDEEPGEPGEICRYNQVDATRGSFRASTTRWRCDSLAETSRSIASRRRIALTAR